MFVIVLSVVVRGPAVDPALRGSHDEVFTWFKPQIFEAIGVISFAVSPAREMANFHEPLPDQSQYVCHHNSLLIYGSLKTPTLDRSAIANRRTYYVLSSINRRSMIW
jgi:sodium-coupled neutral amino acid transporter 11